MGGVLQVVLRDRLVALVVQVEVRVEPPKPMVIVAGAVVDLRGTQVDVES